MCNRLSAVSYIEYSVSILILW